MAKRKIKKVGTNRELILTPHNQVMDAMSKMRNKDIKKEYSQETGLVGKCTIDDVRFEFLNNSLVKCSYGVSSHKLLLTIANELLSINDNKTKKPNLIVTIPMEKYAKLIGADITPRRMRSVDAQEKENARAKKALYNVAAQARKDLQILRSISVHFVAYDKYKKSREYYLRFASTCIEEDMKTARQTIYFGFDEFMAKYIIGLPKIQIPPALFAIDGNHDIAYCVGYKLTYHYSNERNVRQGTNDIIQVNNVLKATPLPDYDTVLQSNNKSWKRYIKEPLEEALEHLVKNNIVEDWEYTGAKGQSLGNELFENISFAEWSKLYIKFKMTYSIELKIGEIDVAPKQKQVTDE